MSGEQDQCSAARLLALVRSGDERALDWVTRCYGARLLATARRHCRTGAEAEDAVQDTLLTAATELEHFRGEGSMEGWLVRVVANACRRMGRGTKNDSSRHEPEAELASNDDSPEALAQRGQVGVALERALLELDPTDRSVLLLAEVEEWQGPEIAAELGLTPGAVRARLTRVRARLREVLTTP